MLKHILLLALLVSCGDNSPFDEDYWEDPNVRQAEQDNSTNTDSNRTFTVNLNPLTANVGQLTGTATIAVDQDGVTTTTAIREVPEILMIGQRSISNQTCEQIALTYPPPVLIEATTQFKEVNTAEAGTREALIAELLQVNPQNGSNTDLTGSTYVVKAFVVNANSPAPTTTSLIPIACGIIEVQAETTPGTTGVTTGGTATGGLVGGTVGGTTAGSSGGAVGGTVSGSVSGSVGGAVSGSVGGSISGAAGGTVSGSVGGTVSGTVGGNISGVVGGTVDGGDTGTSTSETEDEFEEEPAEEF